MKIIKLEPYGSVKVSDSDYKAMAQIPWRMLRLPNHRYAVYYFQRNGKTACVLMHRLLLNAKDGQPVDHADGDGLNNQRENIRTCTPSQNSHNSKTPKSNKSGFKGVLRHQYGGYGPYWVARIRHDGINEHLGNFKTAEAAAEAYNKKALELFGSFAKLNELKSRT
jgi:hypothetical protein